MIPARDRARCDSAAESQDSRYQVWRVELQTTNHGYRIENYTSSSSSLWNRFLRFALVWLLSQSESRVKITNQQGNIINRIPNKKRSNAFISVLKNIFRKYQSCLNSCEIWLERGPSDLKDCGARRRAAKVVTTRLPIHPLGRRSLAGGTADYGPCSQNRQPDITIFTFSQSDFSDSIWFGSKRREQVESKRQISM